MISLPETNRFTRQGILNLKQVFTNYGVVLKNRTFLRYTLATGMGFSAIIAYATINPYLLQTQLSLSPQQYGFWAAMGGSGLLVGMLVNSRMADYVTINFMLKLGLCMLTAMGIVLAICGSLQIISVAWIIVPTFFMSLGIAFIFPNASIGALAPFPKIAGAAGALYGCAQIMVSSGVSLIVMRMSETSQLPMGILMTALGGIGLLGYWLLTIGE